MGSLSIWHWIVTLALFALYALPGIVASTRHHHNAVAVWVVNLFLGWTFLGWIVAFVWSLTSPAKTEIVVVERVVRSE